MTEFNQGVPAHVQLIQMGTAGAVANVVHIAAALGLADKLADGPKRGRAGWSTCSTCSVLAQTDEDHGRSWASYRR